MSTTLPYVWTLTVGDWSMDGHNLTTTHTFKSNYSLAQVKDAYTKARIQYDLDLSQECRGYEETKVSDQFFNRYREVFADNQLALDVFIDDYELGGIAHHYTDPDDHEELAELRAEIEDEDEGYLNADSFAEAYLFMAKLILPDLVYDTTNYFTDNENIGGYGLLSH